MRLNHITAEDVDALPLPGGPYNINCPLRVFFIPDSKTDNGRRFVPISDRALELLKARCGERREGWIFTAFSASGHLTTVGRKFREARREAGLPEKLVLYCGRHDYGTRVLQGTGNLAVVMRGMGTAVRQRQ
jgi:integrase